MLQRLEVGQFVPAFEPDAIYREGRSRWYALLVYPQRERAAKAWFGKWWCDAFYPVTTAYRWRRNRMVPYSRCYLPGYLFVCFPGAPRWHTIFGDDRRLIRDVLRMSDGVTPGELHPDTITTLEAMRDMDIAIEERIKARRALRRGDTAKLNDGTFDGHTVEIVKVDTATGRARFELKLMGRVIKGEAALDRLDKVALA